MNRVNWQNFYIDKVGAGLGSGSSPAGPGPSLGYSKDANPMENRKLT
jgi:hypothetical protein